MKFSFKIHLAVEQVIFFYVIQPLGFPRMLFLVDLIYQLEKVGSDLIIYSSLAFDIIKQI